ncbi:MAG: lycopene cyclase family protein [Nitritalea sp.]
MKYDIVICGFGCAGMSFLFYALQSTKLNHLNILVIDPQKIRENDRTWCYWAEEPLAIHPKNAPLVSWNTFHVSHPDHGQITRTLQEFNYYHIKGSDFYASIFEQVTQFPNVHFLYEKVINWAPLPNNRVRVQTENHSIEAAKVIWSIPEKPKQPTLKQVFVGWKVTFDRQVIRHHAVTFMAFDKQDQHMLGFYYVLPYSGDTALIEYTIYAKTPPDKGFFHQKLIAYLNNHYPGETYTLEFEEQGAIPMSTRPPVRSEAHPNVIYSGTAGACTKASTGFTFMNVQRFSQQVVMALHQDFERPVRLRKIARFGFYDNILLNAAVKGIAPLDELLHEMFVKNDGDSILRFLDEQSHLGEEVKLLASLTFKPYIQSLLAYARY